MKYLYIILFFFLSYSSFSQSCDTTKEKIVLLDFFESLNGNNWINNENWGSTQPTNTWYGITTNSKGCVTSIEFITLKIKGNSSIRTHGNNLVGQIPNSIRKLSFLKTLNLRDNKKLGKIPKEIGQLKQLTTLNLANNQIEGEIPKELFDIPYLTELNLSYNRLQGTIPTQIGKLQYLQELHLEKNELSNFPNEITKLTSIRTINISENNLSGNLPKEIKNLINLSNLNLSKNHLSGQIPSELIQIKTLRYLSLDHNQFTGIIPKEISPHKKLMMANLQYNQISGCIAQEDKQFFSSKIRTRNNPKLPYEGFGYKIKRAKSLKNAPCNDGNSNTINDKINDYCLCVGLQTKNLTNQEIDSVVLLTFFRESRGKEWKNKTNWLSQNPLSTWHGIKVNMNNRVIEINLDNNKLSGILTKEIENLTQLQVLNLAENRIWKKIPEEIANLEHLKILSLNDNNFTDCIPQRIVAKYCKLSKKKKQFFNLNNNPELPFQGDLDLICKKKSQIGLPCKINNTNIAYATIDENCECKGIKYIDCRQNDFDVLMALYEATNGDNWTNKHNWGTSKPLNDWYGITAYEDCVTEINLKSNNLSGYIPKEISKLKYIKSIDLSDNHFESIPDGITQLKSLEYLLLQNSHITGAIPKSIGSLKNLKALDLQKNNLSGSIPKSIGDLESLIWLHLEDNQLSNEIPIELGKLKCDTYLQNNNFSGCIAQSIFRLMEKSVNDDMLNNNPKLPYYGFLKPKNNLLTGAPCYDNNPETYFDRINKNCKCKGKKIPKITQPIVKDSLALISFFDATNGDNWKNKQNWKTRAPLNSWYGIKTNSDGRIIGIKLINNNLNGLIPSDIHLLTELKVIDLKSNRLVQLPKELFELHKLEILDLYQNQFSGKIPTEIGNLSNLTELDLGNNILIGTIPKSLGKLTNLTSLMLNTNHFQGDLPKEVYNLKGLKVLGFSKRKQNIIQPLLKSIRENICKEDSITLITIYKALRMFEYEKDGIITSSGKNNIRLDSNGYIIELNLSHNKYSGFIPKEIGDLKELRKLRLYQNSIHGKIPIEIGQLKKLESLNITHNYHMEGKIPIEIGKLIKLTEIYLNNNRLDGDIPLEICHLPNLEYLDLSNNLLSSIPKNIGNLKKLTALNLNTNQISQKIPTSIDNLIYLERLDLSHNQFYGFLRIKFENLNSLHQLNLSNNKLEGQIPKNIGYLKHINNLNLANNFFSHSIPKEIGNLESLFKLFLGNNLITGNIPKEIGNLKKLLQIDLNDNQLEGPIIDEFAKLQHLKIFYLQNNNLSGCISPQTLDFIAKLKFIPNKSFNTRTGYSFIHNTKLPFNGNISKLKNSLDQIGSPCDDQNNDTKDDKIQENCECKGL